MSFGLLLFYWLYSFSQDGQPVGLLPFGWLTAAVEPVIGCCPGASESGDDLRGGVLSELVFEGHGPT